MQALLNPEQPLLTLDTFYGMIAAHDVAKSLVLLQDILNDGATQPALLYNWFFNQNQRGAFDAMLDKSGHKIDIDHSNYDHKLYGWQKACLKDSSFFEVALKNLVAKASDQQLRALCNMLLQKHKYELFEYVVKEAVAQNDTQKLMVIKDTLLAENTFINDPDMAITINMVKVLFLPSVQLTDDVARAVFLKAVIAPQPQEMVTHIIQNFTANPTTTHRFKAIFDDYIKDPVHGAPCRAVVFKSDVFIAVLPQLITHYTVISIPELMVDALSVEGFDLIKVFKQLDRYAGASSAMQKNAIRLLEMLFNSEELQPELLGSFQEIVMILNGRTINTVRKVIDFMMLKTICPNEVVDLLRTAMGVEIIPDDNSMHSLHDNIRTDIVHYITHFKPMNESTRVAILNQQTLLFDELLGRENCAQSTIIMQHLIDFGCRPTFEGKHDELFMTAHFGKLPELNILAPYIKEVPIRIVKEAANQNHSEVFNRLCELGVDECNLKFFEQEECQDLLDCASRVLLSDHDVSQIADRFMYLVKQGVQPTPKQLTAFMQREEQQFVALRDELMSLLNVRTALSYYVQTKRFAFVAGILDAHSTDENMFKQTAQLLTPHADEIEKHSKIAAQRIRFYAPVLNDHTNEHDAALKNIKERIQQQTKRKQKAIILGVLLIWTVVVPIIMLAWYFKTREQFHSLQLDRADLLAYKKRPEKNRILYTLEHRGQTKELTKEQKIDGQQQTVTKKRKLIEARDSSSGEPVTIFFATKNQKDKFTFKLNQWAQTDGRSLKV